jgi:hypothetical protein
MQAGQELRVGPFVLWRNSAAEWVKRFKVDNTAFFEMYRDERGQPVGEKASILSRPDYSDASYEEFRDAVYCLSTAVWLRGPPSASDAWVFERWPVDVPTPPDLGFNRHAKFSVNFTSANVDLIYPTPYTHRIDINPYSDQQAVDHFAKELSKPRDESMLTAFSHFHLARFDTPYFTSPGDSVEAMWSGFESLLEIDTFGPVPPPAPRDRCERLLRLVRKLLSDDESSQRVGKNQKLQRALREEFSKHPTAGWRPELWTGLAAWSEQFYRERNHHSHGVRADLTTTKVDPYGLSAFEIALHVARAVLRLRWHGDNLFFEAEIGEQLNSLFLFSPVISRINATLRQHDRKAWYPGSGGKGPALTAAALDEFHRDLTDLSNLRSDFRLFYEDVQVGQARQKMGLVLSAWVTDLLKQPPANVTLGAAANAPALISALAGQGKKPEEIDTEVATMLSEGGADDAETYGSAATSEPSLVLHGRVPLWLWISGYIKLTEAWQAYRLK